MSFFSSFGGKVRGLLGGDLFTDRLAQAQAFASGDYDSAAKIGATMRDWKEAHPAAPVADHPAVPEMPRAFTPLNDRLVFDRPGFGRTYGKRPNWASF